MKVFCNGNVIEGENLNEIFEPGFLFGWGVFETLRAYQGKIPFLKSHIGRLNDGLNTLGIEETNLDFKTKIEELLKINSLEDAYIRITAYKTREGTGVIIYADKFGYYQPESYEKGFSAVVSPYRRNTKSPFSQLKSLSYLENRVSWLEAQKVNKDEALILSQEDYLIGGSRSNLFLVKNKCVLIPSIKSGAFDGITRRIVIEILKDLRIKAKEIEATLEDLYDSDEAFLTSALLEVMPLVECGSRKIGDGTPGEITRKVLKGYRGLV
jgi:branched-chain amino acid aminotransferase